MKAAWCCATALLIACGDPDGSDGDASGRSGRGAKPSEEPAEASPGPRDGPPDAGSGGAAGEAEDPCVESCLSYGEQCVAEDSCEILCRIWRDGFAECQPEYDVYFECVRAASPLDFDCSQDFLLARVEACSTENAVLWYCDRSEGQDCLHEPALDESCTTGTPKPPNFTLCRYDVTPDDCVPYTGTVGDSPPTGWCCP
jgi:hypothetical protein